MVGKLRTIRDWITETGESPYFRQVGERVGLSSTSSVAYRFGRLEARGLACSRPDLPARPSTTGMLG
ncbi:hypothetical protein [Streptomyces sp. NPDC048473]|uniref:LexA family protein n=1 Tax=unclassified Streptomyces TaxID=2593676 RepID=UPI003716BEC6